MALDTLLFNLHDLTLLFAVGQYLLLSVFLAFTHRKGDKSTLYLILILLFNAAQSADTFMIWSEPVRDIVLDKHPSILFWGSIGFWLQGPLLYWYVGSVLYRDFAFTPIQFVHLIPALVVTVLLYLNYYSLADATQIGMMRELQFMFGAFTERLVTYRHISVLIYGVWCLYEMFHYKKHVRQQYAAYDASERQWLLWIVAGVVTISAWTLFVHKIGMQFSPSTSNMLGLVSNYLTFIFINTLVFLSIRYAALFEGITPHLVESETEAEPQPARKTPYTEEQVARLEKYMLSHKPYLINDIHIDSLAKKVSIPARTLSLIINQRFGVNFFEFINRYRIEDAKRILSDKEAASKTVLEVIHETGFGSKSSFNSIFKQHVGMTPSEFRKQNSRD